MNRGRGHENIFNSKEYFHAFILTLAEAHNRFDLQIVCCRYQAIVIEEDI
ncbi:MAG: hypothetical protein HQL46_05665 [Gammaproteobacteria bacterium]|nr:hypothetical protein [Gammaproteobacteria bacterium]